VIDAAHGQYHFTYAPADGDLQQGDVLSRTDGLNALLEQVHRHYLKPDYTHFMITTQSCDLVRRDGCACKTRYVAIAAVRPLSVAVEREIARHQDDFDAHVHACSTQRREKVIQFMERVLNNNESEYFYLEPEATAGLVECSCAFLRLSIAIRAHEHYDVLRDARCLSLSDVFQAKLGWLIGHMYSRIGTREWVPETLAPEAFKTKIDAILDEIVTWVEPERLKSARKAATQEANRNKWSEILASVTPSKKKQQVLDAVVDVIRKQESWDESRLNALRVRLNNDTTIASLVK